MTKKKGPHRPLTATAVKNAKYSPDAEFLFDSHGLRLKLYATGKKVWQLPFKINGKSNIHTIGEYGTSLSFISLAEARDIRDERLGLIKQGINPNHWAKSQKQKTVQNNLNTFKSVALTWHSDRTYNSGWNSEKYHQSILRRLEVDVFPQIGHMPITEIKDIDIRNMLFLILRERDVGDITRRVGQYCSAIFEYAKDLDLCEHNPALGKNKKLPRMKRQNRKHMKTEEQLIVFCENLEKEKKKTPHSVPLILIELILLTGLRGNEIRNSQWKYVDFKKKIWTIPADKMKMPDNDDHIVPLPKQAIALLEKLRTITGNREAMFPGEKPNKPYAQETITKKVKELSNNKATTHGIRHTISTTLNQNNFNRDHIEMQLAHKDDNQVRERYNKAEYLPQRTEMMQWWADYIEKLKYES